MKIHPHFASWEKSYLFQELEETYRNLPPGHRNRVIPLAIGDPDLPTPAGIREAMIRACRDRYFGYPSVEGRKDLREAITRHYRTRFNVAVHPDEILIGPGAKTDLFDLCAVFARPGDIGAVLDPAYPVYSDSLTYRGVRIEWMTGTPQNGYMPYPRIAPADAGRLALIYLCYPNNPTGITATRSYARDMIDFAVRGDALIVHDIAYADFMTGTDSTEAFSIFALDGAEDIAIEVGSFSKPFSMTGDRIGWVVIRNRKARMQWRRYRSNRDSGVSEIVQLGALAALSDPDVTREVRDNMRIYRERADILMEGLSGMSDMVMGLRNSPYAWFKSPIPDSRKAAGIILEKALVQVTPGVGFGPAGEGFLRATLFQPADKLREALNRMRSLSFETA
ncbi:pyridoxal phosphate-dependent aminotransferase [bacterium]|nr:pyridoxal phosphate-dependent aminotransferase [candidate division CSSED10-310 bacterium]